MRKERKPPRRSPFRWRRPRSSRSASQRTMPGDRPRRIGTPAAPRYARLSQRTVEGVVRDVFHLRKAETIIGREQGDIVFTDDPFLSRRHCAVRVQQPAAGSIAGRFALVDLGSSNGTFLQVREEVRLRHGDHFRIGQQLFRFDT